MFPRVLVVVALLACVFAAPMPDPCSKPSLLRFVLAKPDFIFPPSFMKQWGIRELSRVRIGLIAAAVRLTDLHP